MTNSLNALLRTEPKIGVQNHLEICTRLETSGVKLTSSKQASTFLGYYEINFGTKSEILRREAFIG